MNVFLVVLSRAIGNFEIISRPTVGDSRSELQLIVQNDADLDIWGSGNNLLKFVCTNTSKEPMSLAEYLKFRSNQPSAPRGPLTVFVLSLVGYETKLLEYIKNNKDDITTVLLDHKMLREIVYSTDRYKKIKQYYVEAIS